MKTMKNMSSTMLCLLAVLLMASGCSESDSTADNESAEDTAALTIETESRETARADIKDGLPEDIDLQGQKVSFIIVPECAAYDILGESGGDIIFDAVYNRNLRVEERLNVDIDCIEHGIGYEHDAMAQTIRKAVMSSSNEFSAVMQRGMQAFNLSLQGMYMNLNENDYIDLTKPWWNDSISDFSINTEKVYTLMGDITMSPFLFSTACFVNKEMMKDYSLDIDELYETVQNGSWTYDVFRKYCAAAYSDIDGDGKASENDHFGFAWTNNAAYFTRSAGIYYISRDNDGYPTLALNNEKTGGFLEKLNSILHDDTLAYHSPKKDITEVASYFITGKNLFFMGRLMWVTGIYSDNFRNMQDPYGIIPYPKYSEEDEYMSGTGASSGNLVAVPITCTNYEETSIVIEAMCAESYRSVFPAFYEIALKSKYADANIDSQMIDLIHERVYNDFTIVANLDILIDNLVRQNKNDFSSAYASNETKMQKALDKMINDYIDAE